MPIYVSTLNEELQRLVAAKDPSLTLHLMELSFDVEGTEYMACKKKMLRFNQIGYQPETGKSGLESQKFICAQCSVVGSSFTSVLC